MANETDQNPSRTQHVSNKRHAPKVTHIVIVDRVLGIVKPMKGRLILTPKDYIAGDYTENYRVTPRTFVINLCNRYSYLKTGYYCSLLADARDQFCIPAISDIIHAHWKRLHTGRFQELETSLNDPELVNAIGDHTEMNIFFGRTQNPDFEEFGRLVFDAFRLPAANLKIGKRRGKLVITSINPILVADMGPFAEVFNNALNEFSGLKWAKTRESGWNKKYWLAVLYDPNEEFSPSNEQALRNLVRVGKTMGFYVERITKNDLNSLLEFDALFIRETTAVNNHTYRFAEKAAREGLAVIDDPVSILRCCNKAYLQEMLLKHNLPTPRSQLLYRLQKKLPKLTDTEFPKVLKIPDGSFSRGVYKVQSQREFETIVHDMFLKSEIVLMQDFIKSEFDWRIVVLKGQALFACKYYMAKSHWQIYNHGHEHEKAGDSECVPLSEVPKEVMRVALAACDIIGDGLYGVDLKEVDGQVYVIEVNDNPNIDAGIEDELLRDDLYRAILDRFKVMIDGSTYG